MDTSFDLYATDLLELARVTFKAIQRGSSEGVSYSIAPMIIQTLTPLLLPLYPQPQQPQQPQQQQGITK